MPKKENLTPVIDSVEALSDKMAKMREAQKIFSTYTQEQVDKIFLAAATAANKARIPLAKMAVEETGMGLVEDKVIKNHYAAEYVYNAYKATKTCGVFPRILYTESKNRGTRGTDRSGYPYDESYFHRHLQDTDCSENQKRNHHQSSPRAKKCTAEAARIVLTLP